MKAEKQWYKSKKLWMSVVSMLLVLLAEVFGIEMDSTQVLGIVGAALGYVLSQGNVDAKVRSAELLAAGAPPK